MATQGSDPAEQPESPIDWKIAQSLTGGDEQLLGELVTLFPTESAQHLATIREGIQAGDMGRVERGAHSLKNAANFFGASSLAACALEVEKVPKIDHARDYLPKLEAETARVVAALEKGRAP